MRLLRRVDDLVTTQSRRLAKAFAAHLSRKIAKNYYRAMLRCRKFAHQEANNSIGTVNDSMRVYHIRYLRTPV